MAGNWRVVLGALAIFSMSGNVAQALDGPDSVWYVLPATSYYYAPAPVYSYYWVAPYYYCPSRPAVTIIPVDSLNQARPIPAPPSPNMETPAKKKSSMPPAKVQNNPGPADKQPTIITTRAGGQLHSRLAAAAKRPLPGRVLEFDGARCDADR